MSTTVGVVLGLKHAFAFLRYLRDSGPATFTRCWRDIGCYPKSMSRLVWLCQDAGLVGDSRTGRGYLLTEKGLDLIERWEGIVALDGEPGLVMLTERGREAAASLGTPDGQFVDTSEFARNEDPT